MQYWQSHVERALFRDTRATMPPGKFTSHNTQLRTVLDVMPVESIRQSTVASKNIHNKNMKIRTTLCIFAALALLDSYKIQLKTHHADTHAKPIHRRYRVCVCGSNQRFPSVFKFVWKMSNRCRHAGSVEDIEFVYTTISWMRWVATATTASPRIETLRTLPKCLCVMYVCLYYIHNNIYTILLVEVMEFAICMIAASIRANLLCVQISLLRKSRYI